MTGFEAFLNSFLHFVTIVFLELNYKLFKLFELWIINNLEQKRLGFPAQPHDITNLNNKKVGQETTLLFENFFYFD